jgi:hypothetical protein
METEQESELTEFMRRIESEDCCVYPEYVSQMELAKLYSILVLPLIPFFIIVGYSIQLKEPSMMFPIIIIFSSIMPIAAVSILVITMRKLLKSHSMGVHNITRAEISTAVHVLDLLSHGLHLDGEIEDSKAPVDYSPTTIGALEKSLKVVSKIYEESESNWAEQIKKIVDSKSPASERNLFPLLMIMSCFFFVWWLLVIFAIFEIIPPSMSMHYFIIPFFIGAGIIIALEEFTNRKPLPCAVQRILKDQEIQEQIVLVVNTLLATLKEDAKYPLRFLVLRTYPHLEYTGKTFRTENELELKEAIHIPNE